MSFLTFDKTQLINLEYSLPKEVLLTNENGDYASSTIVGCNTRKYHGLLVTHLPALDGTRHVLLSSVHETIVQHEQEFNFGINAYPGDFNPKGHKYARWFEMDPTWKLTYRVGGVVLQKEILLHPNLPEILIRYTLLEAHSATWLRLKPYMAFRQVHKVSKSNMFANTKVSEVPNGISIRLYEQYPPLIMQLSRKSGFITAPDWYYQVQYPKEIRRGYDGFEDLFVPGYFELQMKKGQPIIFSAGLKKATIGKLSTLFQELIDKIEIRRTFDEMLHSAAATFIMHSNNGKSISPGYHWFGYWGRHVFIALPGLTLALKKRALFHEVLQTLIKKRKGGLFPDHSTDPSNPVFGSADVSLWFIWALSAALEFGEKKKQLRQTYRSQITEILESYRDHKIVGVGMAENGLIHSYLPDIALTWMDSYIDGKPVTQRPGFAVDVNALWYNAISFALDCAKEMNDEEFRQHWEPIAELVKCSFRSMFWNQSCQCLYDYVFNDEANTDIRPNQVFAASFRYSPLDDEMKKSVLEVVKQELVTPKGIRTLSPRHEDFQASYEGDHHKRDLAYHQGTVWPWLLGHFAEGWLRLNEKSAKSYITEMISGFEEDMYEHGIGTISEVYDGNPPHTPCGAISFASSVGEIIRAKYLLNLY